MSGDDQNPEDDQEPDTFQARPGSVKLRMPDEFGADERQSGTIAARPAPTDAVADSPRRHGVQQMDDAANDAAALMRRSSQPFSRTIAPRKGQVGPRESWTFQKLAESPGTLAERAEPRSRLIAGRYELESLLGTGGMGEVYRVRHRQLGKPFALKLMQADFSRDEFFQELFHREAQLASLLQHPNIVSVVDFGEDPDHGLFMVMELIDGQSLTERIKAGESMSLETVCDVVLQVADALAFSHSHHVVHADVKPDNILCVDDPTSRSNEWTVKLLDFGMANLHSAERGEKEAVGGTPEFMAPERIDGQSPRPSMDIYSLGIVMHLLVTGELPFRGDSIDEVFDAHKNKTPPRMSDVLGNVVPERVELLVDRALAKRPADRHPDMASFINDLQAFMKLRGMRQRRKGDATRSGRLVGGIGVARRARAAATAYDDLPVPAGTVLASGTISLANPALAFFLTGVADEPAEGLNILESRLPSYYPGLADDIARVVNAGQRRSAVIEVSDGEHLRVIIKPTRGAARSCTVLIVPLGDD